MNLIKTLENGNKVYEAIEGKVAQLVRIETDGSGNEVRRWKPSFDEIAGHSPTAKKVGR